jgi:photosystem II stability/assembly factor-like uncharacterized protein
MITRIAFDPTNTQTMYITYAGFGDPARPSDNIWKSIDGGMKWINISHTLPSVPIYALTIHPHRPDFIYIGTETGIFASEDAGQHWSVSNEGPVNTAIDDFAWDGATLVAATHGRGLWSIDLSIPSTAAVHTAPHTSLRKHGAA